MRSVGLCFAVMSLLAACDDAVGTGYPSGVSIAGPEMADAVSPAERAVALGIAREIDYACGEGGASAHVTLYGSEEMASLLIPGQIDPPIYLDCSPTLAGPECRGGDIRALINTVEDRAAFSGGSLAEPLSCTMLTPE